MMGVRIPFLLAAEELITHLMMLVSWRAIVPEGQRLERKERKRKEISDLSPNITVVAKIAE